MTLNEFDVNKLPKLRELIDRLGLDIQQITYLDKTIKNVSVILKRKKGSDVDIDRYRTYMENTEGVSSEFIQNEILKLAEND